MRTPEESEEYGYRRGFSQGAFVVLKAIEQDVPVETISAWKQKIWKWRHQPKIIPRKLPPEAEWMK